MVRTPSTHVDLSQTLIVIPTLNERENIQDLIQALFRLYPTVHILIVDDSNDDTATRVRELQLAYSGQLHLMARSGKRGRGWAVLDGFGWAMKGLYQQVVEMDADFSHRPEEVQQLIEKSASFDLVIGSRYLLGSRIEKWGWKRPVFSWLANHFTYLVLGIPISDYTNGFRCYTRYAIEALEPKVIKAKGYVVLSETAFQLYRKGISIGEVPTVFINRQRGISNLTFRQISEAFLSIVSIRVRYTRRGHTAPLMRNH